MKPGWRSTEFWVTIGINLFSMLIISGFFDPDIGQQVTAQLPDKIQSSVDVINAAIAQYKDIAAFIAMAISGFGYSKSRGNAKKNASK